MYVATAEPCRIRVNRVEVGVQGGFDPYPNLDRPRIQQYDILKPLREGEELHRAGGDRSWSIGVLPGGCTHRER